jgi:hypothetical protein
MNGAWAALAGAALVGILGLVGVKLQSKAELRKSRSMSLLERRQEAYLKVSEFVLSTMEWNSWARTQMSSDPHPVMPQIPDGPTFNAMMALARTFGSAEVQEALQAYWSQVSEYFGLVREGPVAHTTIKKLQGDALAKALQSYEECRRRSTTLTTQINIELTQ